MDYYKFDHIRIKLQHAITLYTNTDLNIAGLTIN